jgi:hypothetical protein
MSFKSSQVNCLLHQWHLESYLDCARTRPRTLLGARPLADVTLARTRAPHLGYLYHTWHMAHVRIGRT